MVPQKLNPNTQKAKGIIFGLAPFLDHYNLCGSRAATVYALIKSNADIDKLDDNYAFGTFARPCPTKPRHGFVDSKILKGGKIELESILNKVKAVDTEGEILVTPFVRSKSSAVYSTSGLLSIGPKNDGATSGKNSFSLPVCPGKIPKNILTYSGISKGNVFLEFIYDRYLQQTVLTQIRGGPKTPAYNDYIPKDIVVKYIVKPDKNLLAWESKVKRFKPGTVVYGGSGSTLASHAAIHCVLNKIPFITSFQPSIGQKLIKTERKDISVNTNMFRIGASVAMEEKEDLEVMLYFTAMVVHNWPYLKSSKEHASWLLGMAAVYMSKILCALCLGEFRHFDSISYELGRDTIYSRAAKNITRFISKLPLAIKTFRDKGGCSYGGETWAEASEVCLHIWNNTIDIYNDNIDERKLMIYLNKSMNLIHNNGCLFDKFGDEDLLDAFAVHPGIYASFYFNTIFEKKNKVFKRVLPLPIIGEHIQCTK